MVLLGRNGLYLTMTIVLAGWGVACSSDEDGGDSPMQRDTGVDTGFAATDVGFVDSGPRPDGGFSTPTDAGHYCAMSDQVSVDGMLVPVDTAQQPAMTSAGEASLSCIDAPPDNGSFVENYCLAQCLDFLGYVPTPEEVGGLEFHAFPVSLNGAPVDPSFDYQTYQDRQTGARLPIGAQTVQVDTNDCASGWKLEMGYLDLGADTFDTDTTYIIRVRSSSTSAAFPTTYLYRIIRRVDEGTNSAACRQDPVRIPQRDFSFPVVPTNLVGAGVAAAGRDIPGSDDLYDGLGTGYAIVEVRDCSTGGSPVAGATAGFLPSPSAFYYLDDDFTVGAGMSTSLAGIYLGVGFPGLTATSSLSIDVRAGVGVLRNEDTCTEEYGAAVLPVFPDGVTYVRANRETVIHGR